MKLLDGKKCSDEIKQALKIMLKDEPPVSLTVIQVGEDPASSVYVRNKEKACEQVGIKSNIIKLDENVDDRDLINLIEDLNKDTSVNGILVQLPLPKHINESLVLQSIDPVKDVDGFHRINMGKLALGENGITPCTSLGIIKLLASNNIDIAGKHCVVVGRSNIVGKPTALQLLNHDGTVTICHSKTKNLKSICKTADILVCAIGKPKFFNRDYIGDDAIVIDVGIHRQEDGSLCGDVDFDDVKDLVTYITPVPGGIGPMTVACLLQNCVIAAQIQELDNEGEY